jgi:hypothetical protein
MTTPPAPRSRAERDFERFLAQRPVQPAPEAMAAEPTPVVTDPEADDAVNPYAAYFGAAP